jgi:hypothetical protein
MEKGRYIMYMGVAKIVEARKQVVAFLQQHYHQFVPTHLE